MKRIMLILATVAVAVFYGCDSVKLVTSWKSPDAKKVTAYKKIMVIGLMGAKDLDIRQKSEAAIVQTLKASGVNAQSAYDAFGPKEFRSMSEQEVVGRLKADSVDAVMFVVLLDKAREKDWVPGSVYYTPYAGYYYGCYWCHYNAMYGRVYSPGYFSTTTTYILEADLYSVPDNKLQYSAYLKSVDPSNAAALSQQFSDKVIKDLADKELLGTASKK